MLATCSWPSLHSIYVDSFCSVSACPKDFEQSCCSIIIVPCLVSDQHHAQAALTVLCLVPASHRSFLPAPLPCRSQLPEAESEAPSMQMQNVLYVNACVYVAVMSLSEILCMKIESFILAKKKRLRTQITLLRINKTQICACSNNYLPMEITNCT